MKTENLLQTVFGYKIDEINHYLLMLIIDEG